MTDRTSLFRERIHVSPELAERIKMRWGIAYRAADRLQSSLRAEHGANLLEPVASIQAVPEAARPVNTAQVGSSVISLEANLTYRQEAERLQQDRLAAEARLLRDEAYESAA
jgi:hypothetical protein